MWEQLSINKPHLVYILLGAFTSLFMLCSSIIKERLYIGEATVATIFGIIFGPHAADLINPLSWGNTDQITLEFSRIVLVVQCFAVGVELPKAYMERHWRSVTFLLVPVMTFGWLVTSLFIWAVFHSWMSWLECLAVAACVTATDPVLASSVVGKGKFAKRVPKHLRDLLSAESGSNDGMAFPFIYLALYIIRYNGHPSEIAYHWFCYTVLYECVWGAVYGVLVGYIARRLIRYAHEHDLIDRESFLVFYFVLALFCAGSGSLLGMDDLLVGFACGVGFSNDGWFTEKTEETHVSNVIDLLINLAFFVYFGTIIPWEQYNSGYYGLNVWRLVVIALLVLFFRRIPIMMICKPFIPDIKTWREALFAGHFGPIGVGAIFVAILARAELETGETTPLRYLPAEGTEEYNVIYLVWPIVTFLVICSIVVHGSSIAVFTLGKHINTLTLTMSYTKGNEEQSWMERLPRIQSRSRSSMSIARSESSFDEKSGLPPGVLPYGAPGTFLRRQREEDNPSRNASRANSRHRSKRGRTWDSGRGPGGPISQSAIAPARRQDDQDQPLSPTESEMMPSRSGHHSDEQILSEPGQHGENVTSPGEIYEEGNNTIFEDKEGNVLAVEANSDGSDQEARELHERLEAERLMRKEHADENNGVAPTKDDPNTDTGHEAVEEVKHLGDKAKDKAKDKTERPGPNWRGGWNMMGGSRLEAMTKWAQNPKPKTEKPVSASGPARAYQYGNTIIVEDEDGEVIKKYDIPAPERKQSYAGDAIKSSQRIGQMSKILGLGPKDRGEGGAPGPSDTSPQGRAADKQKVTEDDDDERVRFTISAGGRRMSKAEFIDQIRQMDPKARATMVEDSNAPEAVKREARKDAREHAAAALPDNVTSKVPIVREDLEAEARESAAIREDDADSSKLHLVDSNDRSIPFHDVPSQLRQYQLRSEHGETAAERRRRQALQRSQADDDSEDDGTERIPPAARGRTATSQHHERNISDTGETAAERRRREGALGLRRDEEDDDSEDDDQPRQPPQQQNIRFADHQPAAPRQSALRWGKDRGR